jgi:hypothetical protein
MLLIVNSAGGVRCLYDEAIELCAIGSLTITRASHVEPDASGHWWADLTPVGGVRVGPFTLRSEALAAERIWLEEHGLPLPCNVSS